MRLLIIASDSSGRFTLASPQAFADTTEAAREISRLLAEDSADISTSFRILDVDAAVPVIIVQRPAAEPVVPEVVEPVEEPFAAEVMEDASEEAEPVEAPAEPEVVEAVAAPEAPEPVAAPEAPELVQVPEAPELLEVPDEPEAPVPAVEPEAVEALEVPVAPEPANAPEESEPDVPSLGDEASSGEALEVEPAPQLAEPSAGAQWPWDLPVIPEEGTADDVVTVPETGLPDLADADATVDISYDVDVEAGAELKIDESSDVAFEPSAEPDVAAETPAEPQPEPVPVDLGDVVSVPGDETPSVVPQVPDEASSDDTLASLIAAIGTPDAPSPDPDDASSAEAAAVLVVAEPQGVLDAPATLEAAASDGGPAYEPGALNLGEYTCGDCVYVNTCPNRDQKKPAECGSFQWKA